MTKKVSAADVLDEAATLLDETGWCRYKGTDYRGRHCAVGAIDAIAGGGRLSFPATDALAYEVCNGLFIGSRSAVAAWNDTKRDKRTVQRAMRRAAKKLREDS